MYRVYAKLDSNKCITDIESTAFHAEDSLINDGYTFIDEGEDGVVFGHAQPNYLMSKKGKEMFDEESRPNFKFTTKVIALSDREKERWFPATPSEPTEIEKINDRITKLESVVNLFKKEK